MNLRQRRFPRQSNANKLHFPSCSKLLFIFASFRKLGTCVGFAIQLEINHLFSFFEFLLLLLCGSKRSGLILVHRWHFLPIVFESPSINHFNYMLCQKISHFYLSLSLEFFSFVFVAKIIASNSRSISLLQLSDLFNRIT